jgi:hypothetical protein
MLLLGNQYQKKANLASSNENTDQPKGNEDPSDPVEDKAKELPSQHNLGNNLANLSHATAAVNYTVNGARLLFSIGLSSLQVSFS